MESKTAKEWFSMLPEMIKQRALANEDESISHLRYKKLSAALSNAFVWKYSPEGRAFWKVIFNYLHKNGI